MWLTKCCHHFDFGRDGLHDFLDAVPRINLALGYDQTYFLQQSDILGDGNPIPTQTV